MSLKTILHELIEQTDDWNVLLAVHKLLDEKANADVDFWDELSVEQKESIDKGIADLDAGRKKSFAEVLRSFD